jgi:hypothetical protein
MRSLHVLGALVLGCLLAASVEAGPRRVRIVKTDGTIIEGTLEERKEHVYRLSADGKTIAISESDVLRVDFLEEEKSEKSEVLPPRSPWLRAKPGDWATYVTTGLDATGAVVGTGATTWRVLAVDGADVTVEQVEEGPLGAGLNTGHEHKDREFIAGLGWGRYKSEKVAIARDRLALGDHTFDCTKATCIDEREEPRDTQRNAVWIDETLPIGFVELDHVQDGKGSEKQVLAGYGNGDRVAWGKRPEEISRWRKIHPFKDVKTGDWWSLATVEDHKPGFETWSAKQADGAFLDLELGKSYPAHRGDDPFTWIASFVGADSKVKAIRSASLMDEKRTVLGRTFDCVKLTAELEIGGGGGALRLSYSFAKDGLPPIVACTMQMEGYSYEGELRGYGNGATTAWGKTKAELEAPAPDKIQPWKNVKTGDWWTFSITDDRGTSFGRCSATEAGGETVDLEGVFAHGRPLPCERNGDATSWLIGRLSDMPDVSVKVVPDTRTIDGRTFRCWRVSLERPRPGGGVGALIYWTAADGSVPVIAFERDDDRHAVIELRGYGDGDKTVWGKTEEELEAPAPDKIQPWKNVKTGDWWSYEAVTGGRPTLVSFKWSVEEVTGETLSLRLPNPITCPRAIDALSFVALMDKDAAPIESPSLAPASRTIGEKTVPCWKLSGVRRFTDPKLGKVPTTYWIAVDGSIPIVAAEMLLPGGLTAGWELRGYGNGATKVWGQSGDELEAARAKGDAALKASVEETLKRQSWSFPVRLGAAAPAKGDWASYRWQRAGEDSAVLSKGTATFEVTDVKAAGAATLAVRDAAGGPARDKFELEGKGDVTIDLVRYVVRVGATADPLPASVAVTTVADDSVTVNGHTFAARKVDFVVQPEGGDVIVAYAWFSSEVKASGLVKAEFISRQEGTPVRIRFDLAGDGTEKGPAWGEALETAGDKANPLH